MNENDYIPTIAQAPLDDPSTHPPTHILVNGYSLTVEEYNKNKELWDNKPINPSYINTLYQTISKRSLKIMNLDLSNLLTKKKIS